MVESPSGAGVARRASHIYGLDVIRFVAALMVVGHHTFYRSTVPGNLSSSILMGRVEFPLLTQFTWMGWVGVEIFFVISGVVITASAQAASAYRFAKGRFLRLYPTAWICIAATALALLAFGGAGVDNLLPKALLQSTLLPKTTFIDGSYWTLPVELGFYLAVLAMIAFRWVHRIDVLALILIATTAIAMLPVGHGQHLVDRIHQHTLAVYPRYAAFFGLGILMQLAVQKGASAAHLIGAGVAIIVSVIEIMDSSTTEYARFGFNGALLAASIWVAMTLLLWISIRYASIISDYVGRHGKISNTIGLMTYPLYLIHQTCGAIIMRVLVDVGAPAWLAVCLMLGAVLAWARLMVLADTAIRPRLGRLTDRAAGVLMRRSPTPATL